MKQLGEIYGKASQDLAPAVEKARDPEFPEAQRRMQRAAIHLADHLHEVPGSWLNDRKIQKKLVNFRKGLVKTIKNKNKKLKI